MNKRNSKNNNNKLVRSNRNKPEYIRSPPAYVASTLTHRVFRFINFHTGDEGQQTYQISPAKVCALQVIGTVLNTSANQLYESARITKIRAWANPTVDGNIATMRVEFGGTAPGILGNNKSKSCQSSGTSNPGYLSLKPDFRSQAAQWQNGDVTTAPATSEWFRIVINTSSSAGTTTNIYTVDLHVTLRTTSDPRLTAPSTVLLSTVAVGSFYNLALDNPAGGTLSSGNNWVPSQTLATTT